jgi:hypothetical protein
MRSENNRECWVMTWKKADVHIRQSSCGDTQVHDSEVRRTGNLIESHTCPLFPALRAMNAVQLIFQCKLKGKGKVVPVL